MDLWQFWSHWTWSPPIGGSFEYFFNSFSKLINKLFSSLSLSLFTQSNPIWTCSRTGPNQRRRGNRGPPSPTRRSSSSRSGSCTKSICPRRTGTRSRPRWASRTRRWVDWQGRKQKKGVTLCNDAVWQVWQKCQYLTSKQSLQKRVTLDVNKQFFPLILVSVYVQGYRYCFGNCWQFYLSFVVFDRVWQNYQIFHSTN